MASKGRPYRTTSFEGYEILVGKGADDNDRLTFEVAAPDDLWLHVGGGTPGSHVVVRNPSGGEVPRAVIRHAATLAAWYSKARSPKAVDVDYCAARDVRKPKRAPAGLVELVRHETVRVVGAPIEGDG